jgi:hypothetical protein
MKICRSLLTGLILLWCGLPVYAQEPYSQLLSQGPLTLLIAYKCKPENRVKLRDRMIDSEIANLAKWKQAGLLAGYRILFTRYLDTDNYDMLSLLSFKSYLEVSQWKSVEQASPGGLSQVALTFVTSATTYAMDRARYAASTQPQSSKKEPVFLIVPYDYSVSADQYVSYLDGYVLSQLNGWMQEQVLSAYDTYLARYAAGRPWSSMLVLEYADGEALGKRESIVAKVRSQLQRNAEWRAFSERKQSVRVEKEAIIADQLAPR